MNALRAEMPRVHLNGVTPKPLAGCLPQVEDLMKDFGPKDYQTSTRGQRSVEAVRALGEGLCWAHTKLGRLVPALQLLSTSPETWSRMFGMRNMALQTFLDWYQSSAIC